MPKLGAKLTRTVWYTLGTARGFENLGCRQVPIYKQFGCRRLLSRLKISRIGALNDPRSTPPFALDWDASGMSRLGLTDASMAWTQYG